MLARQLHSQLTLGPGAALSQPPHFGGQLQVKHGGEEASVKGKQWGGNGKNRARGGVSETNDQSYTKTRVRIMTRSESMKQLLFFGECDL